MNISVIIPTLNRPDDLKLALESIGRQTLRPAQVIVVDQSTGDESLNAVFEVRQKYPELSDSLVYVSQTVRSLVKARNNGMALASGDVISFLDDDVVLFDDYYARVLPFFEDPEVGGVSGNTLVKKEMKGLKWKLRKAVMRFFMLSDFNGGMTASGFGYPVYEREIDRPIAVQMLPGCNMNFRKKDVRGLEFDEWFSGYGFREDADFSYRVSLKARLLMTPDARLHHNYSPANRMKIYTLKKMELKNYYYMFKKYKRRSGLSCVLFGYSFIGLILIDLIEFLTNLDGGKWCKLRAEMSLAWGFAFRTLRKALVPAE